MNLRKRMLQISFALVVITLGFVAGGYLNVWKAEASVGEPTATEIYEAGLTGSNPAIVGFSTYKVFDNGSREFIVYLLTTGVPNGTTLTVEVNNSVVAQPVVANGEISLTIASPSTVPVITDNTPIAVKNGAATIAAGVFVREVVRPTKIYLADAIGVNEIPSVNTNAQASGILFFEEGGTTVELAVIGTNFAAAPTSVTINGPAPANENGPVVYTFTDVQSFPSGSATLFVARGEIPLTPALITQLSEGLLYTKVRTPAFPNGEVRGQFALYNPDEDFEGDGKADISVYRPSEGAWYILNSSDSQVRGISLGSANDKIIPGDYDGDSISDLAVFKRNGAFGTWVVRCSSESLTTTTQWGLATDLPVVADFDGDRRDDLTVFRPDTGTWYIRRNSDVIKPRVEGSELLENFEAVQWGQNGDVPFAADFDGDRRADLTVFRPSNGTWYILKSSDGALIARNWGLPTDTPLIGNFDGGRSDIAVFRPSNGTWYILNGLEEPQSFQFGTNGDIPTAADYDGDSLTDISVFRPSEGNWYGVKSLNNQFFATRFGQNGDIPTTAP